MIQLRTKATNSNHWSNKPHHGR